MITQPSAPRILDGSRWRVITFVTYGNVTGFADDGNLGSSSSPMFDAAEKFTIAPSRGL
jgi:hypothetical protein